MQISPTFLAGPTCWQRDVRRRRVVGLVVATLVISAFILLVEFSSDSQPLPEIDVFVLPPRDDPEAVVEQEIPLEVVEPVEEQPLVDEPEEQVAEEESPPEEEPDAPRDWYAQMEAVVESIASEQRKTYSLNPVQDEARRQAADKFRASRAPVRKEIWENVEVDQLGRKILVSGDCHRVIDDPSATRQDAFREFYQFIVFCSKYKRNPKELPWVEEIRERYVYLQPDESQDNSRTEVLAELQ